MLEYGYKNPSQNCYEPSRFVTDLKKGFFNPVGILSDNGCFEIKVDDIVTSA